MKKIVTILTACLVLASCAKFTDLKPKGMNMLSSADELELLLNAEYRDFYNFDMYQIPGDVLIGSVGSVANLISTPTPSRNSILVTWDAANVKRLAELTASDDDYRMLYGFVGQIAWMVENVYFATFIQKNITADGWATSATVAASAVAAALATIFSAAWSDRVGRRRAFVCENDIGVCGVRLGVVAVFH